LPVVAAHDVHRRTRARPGARVGWYLDERTLDTPFASRDSRPMTTSVIAGKSSGRDRYDDGQGPLGLGGLGLVAVRVAYALQVLNFFVVTVALGSLESELQASESVLELVVAGFGVAYASTVVLGGRLGDNLGRRRVMRVGLVWFGAASVWCALAPS